MRNFLALQFIHFQKNLMTRQFQVYRVLRKQHFSHCQQLLACNFFSLPAELISLPAELLHRINAFVTSLFVGLSNVSS